MRDTDSNSVWDMQFIWPFKVEYRIVHINDDYTQTIIGRNKRDYVWIMARTPALTETEYRGLVRIVAERGYDTDLLRPVPQRC